jgi:hypothetical protein
MAGIYGSEKKPHAISRRSNIAVSCCSDLLDHVTDQEVFDPPMLDVGSHGWGGGVQPPVTHSRRTTGALASVTSFVLDESRLLNKTRPSPPSLTQHDSLALYILCPYILCHAYNFMIYAIQTLSQRCPQGKLAQT